MNHFDREAAGRQTDPAPRAHPDAGLTEQQTKALFGALIDRRRRLLEERRAHLNTGRFASEQIAEAEEAAAWDSARSTMIDLAENERILLAQIERALRKMGEGTYGVSEDSEEPIGFDRLQAVPWAARSAEDQERVERELRQRGR